MQITAVAVLFLAAMGAVASPVESVSDGIDARADPAALILYEGKCTRAKNECRFFKGSKNPSYKKCSQKFANKRCSRDGAKCFYESYDGSVRCE